MESSAVGRVIVIAVCVTCVAAVVTGRRRVLSAAATLAVVATGLLAWGFVTSDFRLRSVAEHSRRSAGGFYRLAGLWAGTAPSLLFWSTVALVLAAVGARNRSMVRAAAAVAGSFAAVSAVAANAFERLPLPPTEGTGLMPVLEHPAMLIHPPMLYVGALCSLPAFAAAFGHAPMLARRWLAASAAILTAALALGSWWAYVEQGWGGYWAWDPVENGGLLPWIAAVAALHLPAIAGERLQRVGATLPFTVAVAGTWLTRSGATGSVHSFAEARSVGWGLGLMMAAVVVAMIVLVVRSSARSDVMSTPDATAATRTPSRRQSLQLALSAVALVIVVIGTFWPVVRRVVGGSNSMTHGVFYSRLLAPVALAALVGAMWSATRSSSRRAAAQRLAHGGFVVLMVGVAGTTFNRQERVIARPGDRLVVLGREVAYVGADDRIGTTADRLGIDRAGAELRVDGVTLRPSLSQYPSTGLLLAETATSRRWWGDVQVAMASRLPSGVAVFDVYVTPLQSFVWLGAVVIAIGLLAATIDRRRPAVTDDS